MNELNIKLQNFLDANPKFKGKFIGYKKNRGGLGITRIDDDWHECEDYLIRFEDLLEILECSNNHLKIYCFNDGDELWADYSLEEAKKNFKELCGLSDQEVEDAFELEESKYDILTLEFNEDSPEREKGTKITYKEYLEEFTKPGYFACSSDLC